MDLHSQLKQLHADLQIEDGLAPWPVFSAFKALMAEADGGNPVVGSITASIEALASNERPNVTTLRVLAGQLMIATTPPASRPGVG